MVTPYISMAGIGKSFGPVHAAGAGAVCYLAAGNDGEYPASGISRVCTGGTTPALPLMLEIEAKLRLVAP
jgi:hypothetical protein